MLNAGGGVSSLMGGGLRGVSVGVGQGLLSGVVVVVVVVGILFQVANTKELIAQHSTLSVIFGSLHIVTV